MKATLVIMAAGIGSRYGGDKQVDGVGPNNELLMEYAVYDAVRAGFSRIVFIVKPEHLGLIKKLCGDQLEKQTDLDGHRLEIFYAFQELNETERGYAVPDGRTKPLGTVHAVLCAREFVKSPFAVINADDYYGIEVYKTLYDSLMALPERGEALMMGYRLKNTVSRHGSVTRGICLTENGFLRRVTETYGISVRPDGSIYSADEDGKERPLDPNCVVSMNMWGFMPAIFDDMERYFDGFMASKGSQDVKAECLLPIMVDDMIREGRLKVEVKDTKDAWFGMTYPEDKLLVRERLLALHNSAAYPKELKRYVV